MGATCIGYREDGRLCLATATVLDPDAGHVSATAGGNVTSDNTGVILRQ